MKVFLSCFVVFAALAAAACMESLLPFRVFFLSRQAALVFSFVKFRFQSVRSK